MDIYCSSTYRADLDQSMKSIVGLEQLKEKKILITGATGTIGSFLIDLLLYYNEVADAKNTLYAGGRNVNRLAERFDAAKTEQLVYLEYDATKPIIFNVDVDYVIHAAGNAYPAAFNVNPVGTIEGNIMGTLRLLNYSRDHNTTRFVYVSSGEVYGQGDLSLDEYEENYAGYVDLTSSRSCYPNSKRTAETLCSSYYQQYGLKTVVVRPCHTYGPWFTERDNRANVQFFRNALRREDIVLNSSGTQMRSYCYIADCASAILSIMLKGNAGEAYNIANPNARTTIAGFAQIVAALVGKKVIFSNPTEKELADQTPIAKQVLSSKKLETLGWHGRYTVKQGVVNTLAILNGK